MPRRRHCGRPWRLTNANIKGIFDKQLLVGLDPIRALMKVVENKWHGRGHGLGINGHVTQDRPAPDNECVKRRERERVRALGNEVTTMATRIGEAPHVGTA